MDLKEEGKGTRTTDVCYSGHDQLTSSAPWEGNQLPKQNNRCASLQNTGESVNFDNSPERPVARKTNLGVVSQLNQTIENRSPPELASLTNLDFAESQLFEADGEAENTRIPKHVPREQPESSLEHQMAVAKKLTTGGKIRTVQSALRSQKAAINHHYHYNRDSINSTSLNALPQAPYSIVSTDERSSIPTHKKIRPTTAISTRVTSQRGALFSSQPQPTGKG